MAYKKYVPSRSFPAHVGATISGDTARVKVDAVTAVALEAPTGGSDPWMVYVIVGESERYTVMEFSNDSEIAAAAYLAAFVDLVLRWENHQLDS